MEYKLTGRYPANPVRIPYPSEISIPRWLIHCKFSGCMIDISRIMVRISDYVSYVPSLNAVQMDIHVPVSKIKYVKDTTSPVLISAKPRGGKYRTESIRN